MRNMVLCSVAVLAMVALPCVSGAAIIAGEDFESPVLTVNPARSYSFASGRTDGTVLPDIWPVATGTTMSDKVAPGTGQWDLTVVDDADDDGRSIGDVGVFQTGAVDGSQCGFTNIQDFCTYQILSNANFGLGNLSGSTTYTVTMDTRTNIGSSTSGGAVTDRTVQIGLEAGGVELGTFASVSLGQNSTETLTYTLTPAEAATSGQVGQPLSVLIKGSFLGEDPTNGVGYVGQVYYDNIAVTPEPATLALLSMGGLFALRRRKHSA